MRYNPNELTTARIKPRNLSDQKAQCDAARAAGIEFLQDLYGTYHFVSPLFHYRIFVFVRGLTGGLAGKQPSENNYLIAWEPLEDDRGSGSEIIISAECDFDLEGAQERILFLMEEEEFPSSHHHEAWLKLMSDRWGPSNA